MKVLPLLRVGRTIAVRVIQTCVFGPACVIALGAALVIAAGASPIEVGITGVYQWAETAVKPASVGQILQRRCQSVEDCDRQPLLPVDARTWIARTAEVLRFVYLMLCAGSVSVMLVHLGWRSFLGLPRPQASSQGAST